MDDNGQWMTSLPNELRNLPIINLAIPGTYQDSKFKHVPKFSNNLFFIII